ncbi:MAG: BCCT family transporter, partial [Elioraea tepidiphila]
MTEAAERPTDTGLPPPEGDATPIETDYAIGQDNVTPKLGPFDLDIHNPVFAISGLTVVAFTFLTLAFQSEVGPLFTGLRDWLVASLDWFFLSAANVFVLLCLALIVSPLGRVRIGGTEATPDYGYASWFAMLFAAGMGIGLVFFGVSEPISHYESAFGGVAVENGVRTDWAPLGAAAADAGAARALGMAATIFHWGLHPWAIYAVVGLALAIFAYNKGLPLTMRSAFYPVLGERVWGWPGHVIDVLAVFATLFGLATSLGLGAQQASAGLAFLFGIPDGDATKVILIVAITLVAIGSVLRGIEGGVKKLSELNMMLAAALVLFVVVTGPTLAILAGFFTNLAAYASELVALSMPFGRDDDNFRQGWTAFYWAWW